MPHFTPHLFTFIDYRNSFYLHVPDSRDTSTTMSHNVDHINLDNNLRTTWFSFLPLTLILKGILWGNMIFSQGVSPEYPQLPWLALMNHLRAILLKHRLQEVVWLDWRRKKVDSECRWGHRWSWTANSLSPRAGLVITDRVSSMFNPSFCKHIISFYKIQNIKNTGLANIDISWSRTTKAEIGLNLYCFLNLLFVCLFLAALGLCCCPRAFSSCGE